MEQTNSETAMPAKMPQFLKVLCILTFIGAGLGLVGGLYNLAKAPTAVEDYQRRQEITHMGENGGFMATLAENARLASENALPLACATIGTNLFCLFGVLMMWKQRKVGFYAYVCGQVIAIAAPAILMGFSGLMIVSCIFPIAFIVMYGLNLKHLS